MPERIRRAFAMRLKGIVNVAAVRNQIIPLDLKGVISRYRNAFVAVALLSAVLNILLLGGSIYMMLVYDSVLPSRSLPTLFGLFLMLIGIYAFQGAFDTMRTSILGHVAASLDMALSRHVQWAMGEVALRGVRAPGDGMGPMRDLDNVRAFLSGSGPATLIDLPWILFFVAVLMLMHVWIGVTALVGGAVLLALTFVANRVTGAPTARVNTLVAARNGLAEAALRHVETLSALGMRGRMLDRWQDYNLSCLAAQSGLARSTGILSGISKVGRMLLQSLILTVGAVLVIRGEASAGVIFASSILSARALAPVDQAIANWRSLAAARQGWARLGELLARVPPGQEDRTELPRPAHELRVEQLLIAPPGTQQITVQGVDFTLQAGDGLAIIGPSAAGKSSLGKALLGIWQPVRGAVRLDGAKLDQWLAESLGPLVGYLPQNVGLLEGTVAENIARFQPGATSEAVVRAAKDAKVHDLIVSLPQGYDTQIGPDGAGLSAGQQQRIALARALYGDPFLVLLDEPNSNLDADGDKALESAIMSVRMRGGIVIVIAHRSSALAGVNKLLILRDGKMRGFGPRDEMLQRFTTRPVPVPKPAPPPAPAVVTSVPTGAVDKVRRTGS